MTPPEPADKQLFRAIIKPNPKATKVLFYLTSYAFPWWVYKVPIERFRKLGYEVIVYDFDDRIIENEDPGILPKTILELTKDMHQRQQRYSAKGIKTFHGIGNSLGSFMLFNYSIRHPLDAVMLNGGGSVADIIFHHSSGSWKVTAGTYASKGYSPQKLRELWKDYDAPELGEKIMAERILLTWSHNDGTIPRHSTEPLVAALKSSGKVVVERNDRRKHVFSVILNAFRVHSIYRFMNKS